MELGRRGRNHDLRRAWRQNLILLLSSLVLLGCNLFNQLDRGLQEPEIDWEALEEAAGALQPYMIPSSQPMSSPTAEIPLPDLFPGTETPPPSDPISTADGDWRVSGIEVPELAVFDAIMRSYMQERGIEGAALAVTRHGALVLARGYNWEGEPTEPVSPESLFRIASLSKQITSMAILNLVEAGRLRLDDRVSELIDLHPAAGRPADERLSQITVDHLLLHLAGWDIHRLGFDPLFSDLRIAAELEHELPISQSAIIEYMSGLPLAHTPGRLYAYSNYGYMLLGQVIEAASGMSYESYVRQEVLGRMGITRMRIGSSDPAARAPGEVLYHSGFSSPNVLKDGDGRVPSPDGGFNLENLAAAGGWIASAVDLARFVSYLDDPLNHPVLSPESIDLMYAPRDDLAPRLGSFYYARGWAVRDYGLTRSAWHFGTLPGTYSLMMRRSDGVGWVVLFNQRDDPQLGRGPRYDLIDDLLEQATRSVTDWPVHNLFLHYR